MHQRIEKSGFHAGEYVGYCDGVWKIKKIANPDSRRSMLWQATKADGTDYFRARTPLKPGQYYAPQFRSDREWYDSTVFPGEPGHYGTRNECNTNGQTWPLGKWLTEPFNKD